MTDQHQPAAAAPRLSPEREAEIRQRVEYLGLGFERTYLRWLLDELDALRDQHDGDRRMLRLAINAQKDRAEQAEASLAQARAELAALRAAVQAELDIDEQEIRSRCSEMPKTKADWYVRESIRGKRLRQALAAAQSEPPAAPVDRSAEAEGPETVRCHVCDVEIAAICDDCLKLVHDRMHELLATTPPDHQAGDEP